MSRFAPQAIAVPFGGLFVSDRGKAGTRSAGQFRFFLATLSFLVAAMGAGCDMPAYITSLDAIHEQEGITPSDGYGYMCTAGAHRGASKDHLENTLAALDAAEKNDRYAFIEFDVQYSGDGRIVVYHDRWMLRLHGRWRAIGNTTFTELSELSSGEIAAYDDVMGLLGKKLNIEIKSQGDIREDERLVDEIVADITSRNREKDVLLSSISRDVVEYVNRKYPRIHTGQVFWLTSSTFLHIDGLTKRLYDEIHETGADYLMLHVANLANIDDLLRFKPKGKTVVFWDFDDRIFIVHKDLSDRLWGDSGPRTFWRFLQYRFISAFRRPQ